MRSFRPVPSQIAALLLLPLLLAACARFLSAPPYDYSEAYANDVFESGFDFVSRRYVEWPNMRRFALTGLEGLSEIDPAIRTRPQGEKLDVFVGPTDVASLALPSGEDSQEWARLVTAVIEAARPASPPLREAEAEEIFEVVYDRALKELDGFSRYAGLEEAIDARAMREGFGGIGVSIRIDEEFATILSVVPGGPADLAGVLADDRVVRVDGAAIAGWTQRELVLQLRGKIDTAVRLTIDRPGTALEIDVTLERQRIMPPTVEAKVEGTTAVVRVSSFNQGTAETVRKTIARLNDEHGAKIAGYVLDLRDNPGGLLDQAVEVADVFLEDGEIVRTRGRHPHSRQHYSASGRDYARGRPIVVLINGDSASASEVVAAALQDRGRAVVVGTNSYGKGTVQTVYRLPNNGELTLTWSRLHAPTGYRLHGLGVMPNICTRGSAQPSAADQLVYDLRVGKIPSQDVLLDWRQTDTSQEETLDNLREACPSAESSPETDVQVAQAILADQQLYRQALEPLAPSVAHR